jgi:hypothetical protein
VLSVGKPSDVSVYADLLRMALDAEPDSDDRPVGDLVAIALGRKGALGQPGGGASAPPDIPSSLGDLLAYDVVLVQLCRRLGVEHEMTGSTAVPVARRKAEEAVAGRLPALAVLVDDAAGLRDHAARRPPAPDLGSGATTVAPRGPDLDG